jgi:exonuclease SbcC
MRILSLSTEQWGALELEELRLTGRGRLHIVYGENEAGKSTTMRAIRALVRGITEDDPAPRAARGAVVRATVELEGEAIDVERRGVSIPGSAPRTRTGLPVSWPVVDREHYDGIVCIDHAALRQGGRAMLRSDGELGSVLLRSLVDGERLDAVQGATRTRLDQLFNPRANARNQRVNAALAECKAALSLADQGGVKDIEFAGLRKAEDDARAALEAARAAREAIDAERRELSTLVDLAPTIASLDELEAGWARLADTGPVPGPDAAKALRAAQTNRTTAVQALRAAEAAVAEAQARQDAQPEDREGLALDADFRNAEAGLEKYTDTANRLPLLRAELAEKEATWRLVAPDDHRAQPSAAESAGLAAALARWADVERECVQSAGRWAAAETALAQARDACSVEPWVVDGIDVLEAAIGPARSALQRWAQRIAEEEALTEREATARQKTLDLGLAGGLADLDRMSLPDVETRRDWSDRWAQAVKRVENDRHDLAAARQALLQAEAEVEQQAPPHLIPDETTLRDKRAARDAGLRATFAGAGPGAAAVEEMVRDADAAADLRFAAADAIAGRAKAERQRDREAARVEHVREALEKHEAKLTALEGAWAEEARRRGLPACALKHLELTLGRIEQLRAMVDVDRGQRARLQRESEEMIEALHGLCAALGQPAVVPSRSSLEATLRIAQEEKDRKTASLKRRAALDSAIEHRQAQLNQERQNVDATRARRDAARQAWTDLATGFGAPVSTAIDLATVWLDQTERAVQARALRDTAARAVMAAEEELQAFALRTEPLLALLDGHPPPAERVARARPRIEAAHYAALLREQAARDRQQAEAALHERICAATAAEATWQRALDDAGLGGGDDVEAALARADVAAQLGGQMRVAKGNLGDHTPEVLRVQLKGRDSIALAEDQAAAERRRHDANATVEEATRAWTVAKAQRDAVDGSDRAASGTQKAATCAAEARRALLELVQERAVAWLLTELQESLGQAAHERVQRAGGIFATLTGHSFAGLDVLTQTVDGHTVRYIVGRRPNGEQLGAAAMSDGTRDSLWLALRIAAVEAELDAGRALPVVLDDVAVHLSEQRTERVLAACDALAARTQVILFTHHRSVVSLAQSALPGCEIVELRSRSVGTPPVPRDAPPPETIDDGSTTAIRMPVGRASSTAPRAAPPRNQPVGDEAYATIVEYIRTAGDIGAGKRGIVDAGHCSEDGWESIRARLEADARIGTAGERRGRRYRWIGEVGTPGARAQADP